MAAVVMILGLFLNLIGSILLFKAAGVFKFDNSYGALIANIPDKNFSIAGLCFLVIGCGMQIMGVVIPYFQK